MQSTKVRTGMPEVVWCADCESDVRLVREAGYGGQDLIYLATERRADRDICRRHAEMHDDLAAEIAADEAAAAFEDDLLAVVSATVWATDPDVVLDEIDAVWAVAS